VVICERELRDGGLFVVFADGHVEWVLGPEAERLLAQMQQDAR